MRRLPWRGRGAGALSRIVDFLNGEGPDGAGRDLPTVLGFDDLQLESRHDFIQWLFPLPEPSRAVPGSPVLTEADVAALRASPLAQVNLRAAPERMLAFYGATRAWRAAADHNHLRITRIIRSLRLLAGDAQADAFRQAVLELLGPEPAVNATTRGFWGAA